MSKKNIQQIKNKIEPINRDKPALNLKIARLKNNGRKEITTKEALENFPIGSLVSYMNKSGIFKTAGYIRKFDDDYFIYLSADFSKKYRVRYKNVLKMWVGNVYKTSNDLVSIVPSTNEKTKLVAKIGKVPVYYTKNRNTLNRYMHTDKYQRMIKWYEIFGD